MENKLKKAFQTAAYHPELRLADDIWRNILRQEKKILRLKIWTYSVISLGSLVALVPSIKILLADLAQSGFYDYISLIFSDSRSIVSYWKEFIFSLGESLPVISILISLSLLFIFLKTVQSITNQFIIKNQLYVS